MPSTTPDFSTLTGDGASSCEAAAGVLAGPLICSGSVIGAVAGGSGSGFSDTDCAVRIGRGPFGQRESNAGPFGRSVVIEGRALGERAPRSSRGMILVGAAPLIRRAGRATTSPTATSTRGTADGDSDSSVSSTTRAFSNRAIAG